MGYDSVLIGGAFFDDDVPPGKEYLFHYFSKPLPKRLLVYYFKFFTLAAQPSKLFHRCFCEHTGYTISLRHSQHIVQYIRLLEQITATASQSLDFDMLHRIKSGALSLSEIH